MVKKQLRQIVLDVPQHTMHNRASHHCIPGFNDLACHISDDLFALRLLQRQQHHIRRLERVLRLNRQVLPRWCNIA